MSDSKTNEKSGRFDIMALAATLPDTATTMLVDIYLTDRESASARIFRVYKPVPPHYHETCDEFLYVLSGRGTFWMNDAADQAEFGRGQLLFFERRTVHAIPAIFEHPLTVLAIDTPRRKPADIVFVDPADGSPATFMARNAKS